MALIRWQNKNLYDPWEDFKSLQDEINALFDVDRFPASTGLFDRSVSPSMDIIEGEHDFNVICELPGMTEKDVDVTIAANVLTIKGEKKGDKEDKKPKYYKRETWTGMFQRTLPLPSSIDSNKVSAELTEGILKITLPKKEEAKPKQISVNIR